MSSGFAGCGFARPQCSSSLIATWRDGARTYASLHQFPLVTDLVVNDGNRKWEIRPIAEPHPLAIVELGRVPTGYKEVAPVKGSLPTSAPADVAYLLVTGVGAPPHNLAMGFASSTDGQHQLLVLGDTAPKNCYSVP
jgi:hypothetical protein